MLKYIIMYEEFNIPSRFTDLKYLGKGGYGEVYRAIDTKLKQYVAIKIIPKNKIEKKQDYERIIREVRIARELSHPNLIKYYDIYESKNYIIISMEYIDGKTFQQKINEDGKFTEEEIKKILPKIVDILNYIHSKNIIHRDIKPSNLFITNNNEIKLGDFGIIRIEGEDKLTKTEESIGTPTYMSPEQILGKEISNASDYYSLGITIYEMVSGQVPFKGTIGQVIQCQVKEKLPPIKVSKRLNNLINGLTIKDPNKRWGEKEIKKYIEEKKLPFLPRKKKNIFISIILFMSIILSIIFIPKLLTPEPTSIEFKGKKINVYSKKGILFEKEMEKEISDAKIVNLSREKAITISYNIRPEYFTGKSENYIKIGEILNKKGKSINNFTAKEKVFNYFSDFSLNYRSKVLFFPEVINGKIFSNKNFYINIYHETYYPAMVCFQHKKGIKNEYPSGIFSQGNILGVCDWNGKIVVLGFNNVLFHQLMIAYLYYDTSSFYDYSYDFLEISFPQLISYNLLGYLGTGISPKFSPRGENLLIEAPELGEKIILKPNGDLEGQKNNTAEITKKFMEENGKLKILLRDGIFAEAKEIIKKDLELSENYGLYGWTIVFASHFANLKFLEGDKNGAIEICLEYAKKYPKYGLDLNNKAAFLSVISGDYKRAKKIWKSQLQAKGYRIAEVTIYPFFCEILEENWEEANKSTISNVDMLSFWDNYLEYLKGLIPLLQKDIKKAEEIFKPSIENKDQEDNATFYFLSKVAEGNPDIKNFEKYIKNYPNGPLYLQFAGACTKAEWDKAKILYLAMEKEQVLDSGIGLIFPVIKKIIKTYPEKFNLNNNF